MLVAGCRHESFPIHTIPGWPAGYLKKALEETMGTVGISFGSPTSGTGFDVSATVATIISNLRNVETPWNNQLTSLQSQDAVLSNLGTMFSNLSNDLSQLTEFQGVLAQKTGSSSDTNVLELTSASPAAVAGTHTVVVNNLAQTSSGYLDAISSASDTLSGSVTIQVGSGTAQTITLDSTDNTLSGLASAINAANIGVTASLSTSTTGTRLLLNSDTTGSGGKVTVSSALTDATTSTAINYNANSSDLQSLTGLGISVGNDGSLSLDATTLDSLLNTDFSGVVGFFQDANSWGMNFTSVLSNAGTASSTGVLKLAGNANSTAESNLNANVSREEIFISTQQKLLTEQLNSANEILQAIPTQLNSVNEIYAAISGYQGNKNG